MSTETIVGTRLQNKSDGFLKAGDLSIAGVYGRVISERFRDTPVCWWHVCCPDGSGCSLNPKVHTVTEHEDGTITVTPSIVTSTWHGWLTCGEFVHV